MDRRSVLKAAAAVALPPFLAGAVDAKALEMAGQPADDLSPLTRAARDAWIYGLALIENAASRADVLKRGAPNTVIHERELVTWDWKDVTTPNTDTLYSRSWINLNDGPVRITVPRSGERYVSVQMMDMYMNSFQVLGTRTTGDDGGTYTLVGPQDRSDDVLAIRSPTPWVWITLRVLVDGPPDLAAAHAVQEGFRVVGPASRHPPAYASRAAPWAQFFASVQALIAENPPPATDTAVFRNMAPLGLGMKGGFDARRFTEAQGIEIQAGIAAAKALMRSRGRQGSIVGGWAYPKFTLGDFGQDYLYRAQVALGGLGALPIVEAMYLRPLSETGSLDFDSAKAWTLKLPGNALPAVDAFWSISMYEATPDGQYFFFRNPIDRYAIGDRTPGLIRGADGGINIWMSRTKPSENSRANWLPTPPERPFSLVFRGYLPNDDLLNGRYHMPRLAPV